MQFSASLRKIEKKDSNKDVPGVSCSRGIFTHLGHKYHTKFLLTEGKLAS